jgi:hypothetical protein
MAAAEIDQPRRSLRHTKSVVVADTEPEPKRRSHRRTKPFVAAEPDIDPPAGKAKNKRALYMALILVVLIIVLAAAFLLKSKDKASAASLATNTAVMGSTCLIVSRPSPRQKSLSALSDENRTLRSEVTGQSICVAPRYEITSITLAKGSSPVGEITESQSAGSPLELMYGSNWVEAVRTDDLPRSAANRYPLADVAHSVGATT